MPNTQLHYRNKLFHLTWPIFLEAVLFSVIGSMDVIMLSRYSDNAVGAVGVVNQLLFLFQVISNIITTGTGILCAQYIGAGKSLSEKQPLVMGALLINGLLGTVFSLVLFLGTDPLLSLMNMTPELYVHGREYMGIVGGFMFIQMLTITFTVLIRSHGHTKATMVFSIIMNLANLVLNYILIYGKLGFPAMGAAGAATATVISKGLSFLMAGCFLFRKILPGMSLRPRWQSIKPMIRRILAFGAPAAGEQISYTLSKLVVTAMITSLGTVAVNTYSYLNTVVGYVYLFSLALGQGSSIIIGWEIGKKQPEQAKSVCKFSLSCAFLSAMAVMGILYLARRPLLGLFTSDPEIIAMGATVLLANFLLEAGRSRNLVIVNALRAAGDVNFPLYIGLFSMWFFSVGMSWVLGIGLGWGLVGIWIGLGLDELFRAIGNEIRWHKGIWERRLDI